MAEGYDERSVPARPFCQYVTHEPPLRLQDGVAPPAQRNLPVHIGCTFRGRTVLVTRRLITLIPYIYEE
jgi:hypothetical protein